MPRTIWIEPTNYCNLKCIMCPQMINEVGERGFMEFDLFKKIIDQCSQFQPVIQLFMGGEPLLHKDIVKMIHYIKKNGLKVLLATNATLLNQSLSLNLINSGIDCLVFSFDGYDKTSYEKIRVGADFDKTLGNIMSFLEMRKKSGKNKPKITLYSLCLDTEKTSEEEMAEYKKLHKELEKMHVDRFIVGEAGPWAGKFDYTSKFKIRKHGSRFIPCPRIWDDMAIRWDGKVVPCCADLRGDVILGEVDKLKLKEIWNGERLVALREMMIKKKYQEIALCRNCDEPFPLSNMITWGLPNSYIPVSILRIIHS
ncbi:MAG: SPASM domain-containing protein [bacterium]